jgi:hypothetical protein
LLEVKNALQGKASVTLADVNMEELELVPPMPTNIVDTTAMECVDGNEATTSGTDMAQEENANNSSGSNTSNGILDESTVLVTTLTGVEIVEIPTMLTATLHEHQVRIVYNIYIQYIDIILRWMFMFI